MIHFNALEASIRYFSEMIATELAERRIYDPKEFGAFIKTRFYAAMNELVRIESSDLEQRRNGLVEAYTSNLPAFKKRELKNQLATLTPKLKELNRLRKSLDDYNEYKQLKGFVREKFGEAELDNFFQNHLKKENHEIRSTKQINKN
jgi:hypothetical protein